MRRLFFSIFVILILLGVYWAYSWRVQTMSNQNVVQVERIISDDTARIEVIAEGLDVPWEIGFLPDGGILVTERPGKLRGLGKDGFVIEVSGVAHIGEGGLLGMALHPDFGNNHWIYLYHTTRTDGKISNIVERFVLSGNKLVENKVIVENIPGSGNHDGGRIKFGPDGFLYVTTGDAQNSDDAQNKDSLAGKILRIRDDGSVPEDNPFGNTIYSYGHRNVQGIAWDDEGRLWATEHGRSGILSGYDELNLIEKGKNYGWPVIQGDESRADMETPIINSGGSTTWAPSGAAYAKGSIFFAGLRGQALYEYKIKGKIIIMHFKNEFGRLRNAILGPDGNLYVLTNNTDGRGTAKLGDDKLIKVEVQ